MQLDVLANDSYGSIASILLQEERSDSCRAGVVQNRLLESGALQPGQAVAIVWGRVYREGDEVLVQTTCVFCASIRTSCASPTSASPSF